MSSQNDVEEKHLWAVTELRNNKDICDALNKVPIDLQPEVVSAAKAAMIRGIELGLQLSAGFLNHHANDFALKQDPQADVVYGYANEILKIGTKKIGEAKKQ